MFKLRLRYRKPQSIHCHCNWIPLCCPLFRIYKVEQNPLSSFEESMLGGRGGEGVHVVSLSSLDIPISVANMVWTGVHRGFAVRAYFENNQYVIATQRAFRQRFNIPRNIAVPKVNTIRSWVRQLEATGSILRRDAHGQRRSIRTPENVEMVRAAIVQSPRRSASKHARCFGNLRTQFEEDSAHGFEFPSLQNDDGSRTEPSRLRQPPKSV